MFFRSVASEKMSNRSKNGSLDSENSPSLARAPKRSGSEVDSWYLQSELCWYLQSELVFAKGKYALLEADPLFETARIAARTLQQPFSESNEPFFDRLDIFSDIIDMENTLVLLFLQHLAE